MSADDEVQQLRRVVAHLKPYPSFSNLKKYESGQKLFNSISDTHNKFPFGAMAELVDNAREAKAKYLHIDVESEEGVINAMFFTDDGTGMDYQNLYSMMEYGQGTKDKNNFGMGFKTGSLTIGREVLVLTKQNQQRSLAFLSRSTNFNEENAFDKSLIIPFIFWHPDGSPATYENPLALSGASPNQQRSPIQSNEEVKPLLKHIFSSRNTLVRTLCDLQDQFEQLKTPNGTRIMIWNLEERFTFSDEISTDIVMTNDTFIRQDRHGVRFVSGIEVPQDSSFRAYCQMLYLHGDQDVPQFQIKINGEIVKFKTAFSERYVTGIHRHVLSLDPRSSNPCGQKISVDTHIGYSPEDDREGRYGFHVYWKDTEATIWKELNLVPRLVQPYFRCGPEDTSGEYDGMVGLLVLTPQTMAIHNGKQTFKEDHNWNNVSEGLNRIYNEFYGGLGAIRHRVSCLTDKGLFFGVPCWAKFKEDEWHPARLLNRFDLQLRIPENVWNSLALEARKRIVSKEDSGFNKCLVVWLRLEQKESEYGIVDSQDLKPWSRTPPGTNTISKKLIVEAEKIYNSLVGSEVEKSVKCAKCQKARITRVENSVIDKLSWSCGDGFFYEGKTRKVCLLRELPGDKKVYDKTQGSESSTMKEDSFESRTAQVESIDVRDISERPDWHLLGVGAYGTVYRVYHEREKRALKVFDKVADSAKRMSSYKNELQTLCSIRHDYCIQVYNQILTDDKYPALLLELCDINLEDAIRNETLFESYTRLDITLQISKGMTYLHKQKIMHTDLKPNNVLLKYSECKDAGSMDYNVRVKISDFGLSKFLVDSQISSRQMPSPSSTSGDVCSRDYYLAPEVDKVKDYSLKADVFAFGWILCECLAGQLSSWRKLIPKAIWQNYDKSKRDQSLLDAARKHFEDAGALVGQCWDKCPNDRPDFHQIKCALSTIKSKTNSHDATGIESFIKNHAGTSFVYRVLSDCDIEYFKGYDKKNKIVCRSFYLNNMAGGTTQIKDPDQGDLMKHISRGGSSDGGKNGSQFISTTLDRVWALWYIHKKWHASSSQGLATSKQFRWYPFVKIDLAKCKRQCKVIDVSDVQKAEQVLKDEEKSEYASMARNYASGASEVIVVGEIPEDAILDRYEINPNGKLGKFFQGISLDKLPASRRKKIPFKRDAKTFESFKDWQQGFNEDELSKQLEQFLEECSTAAKCNKNWPLPRNSGAASMQKSAKHGGTPQSATKDSSLTDVAVHAPIQAIPKSKSVKQDTTSIGSMTSNKKVQSQQARKAESLDRDDDVTGLNNSASVHDRVKQRGNKVAGQEKKSESSKHQSDVTDDEDDDLILSNLAVKKSKITTDALKMGGITTIGQNSIDKLENGDQSHQNGDKDSVLCTQTPDQDDSTQFEIQEGSKAPDLGSLSGKDEKRSTNRAVADSLPSSRQKTLQPAERKRPRKTELEMAQDQDGCSICGADEVMERDSSAQSRISKNQSLTATIQESCKNHADQPVRIGKEEALCIVIEHESTSQNSPAKNQESCKITETDPLNDRQSAQKQLIERAATRSIPASEGTLAAVTAEPGRISVKEVAVQAEQSKATAGGTNTKSAACDIMRNGQEVKNCGLFQQSIPASKPTVLPRVPKRSAYLSPPPPSMQVLGKRESSARTSCSDANFSASLTGPTLSGSANALISDNSSHCPQNPGELKVISKCPRLQDFRKSDVQQRDRPSPAGSRRSCDGLDRDLHVSPSITQAGYHGRASQPSDRDSPSRRLNRSSVRDRSADRDDRNGPRRHDGDRRRTGSLDARGWRPSDRDSPSCRLDPSHVQDRSTDRDARSSQRWRDADVRRTRSPEGGSNDRVGPLSGRGERTIGFEPRFQHGSDRLRTNRFE